MAKATIAASVAAVVRAGRALVECSQEDLAKAAGIGLTTLREIEGKKRVPESDTMSKIRGTLEGMGVYFMDNSPDHGPGVCLQNNRPSIVREPTTMTMWEGIPFSVRWNGKEVTVFVSREVIEDLGRHKGDETDEVYLATFHKHRDEILDGVANAIENPANFDKRGRLYVRVHDIASLMFGSALR